ncbi:hypothetical protein ACFYPZ_14515 [Streptomyces sp. NPDC005506]|uniref:hypothetical protein n=1 Tax=unclassified Streptomyces TaxID=2593676 RepID=UPI0036838FE4
MGPVERDHSLGEDLAGDGGALTLDTTIYAKGLGTAPFGGTPAVIGYELGGRCTGVGRREQKDRSAVAGVDGQQSLSLEAGGRRRGVGVARRHLVHPQ